MLDPTHRRRHPFRPGHAPVLADGQPWPLPEPSTSVEDDVRLGPLILSIVEADRPEDLLRAELALAIRLIADSYDLPPLLLGALLDFPQDDPALPRFQLEIHELAMEHVRAYRPARDPYAPPSQAPPLAGPLGLLGRFRAAISA